MKKIFNPYNSYGYGEDVELKAKNFSIDVSTDDKLLTITNGTLSSQIKLNEKDGSLSLIGKDDEVISTIVLPNAQTIKTAFFDEVTNEIVITVLLSDASEREIRFSLPKYALEVDLIRDTTNPLKYTLIVDGIDKGVINIPKDQFLKTVTYDVDTKELVFVFETSSGEIETRIDVSGLVDTYTAGNGLTLFNNEFSIDTSVIPTKTELTDGLNAKQDTLVSGTNIKTINGEEILGIGDVTIDVDTSGMVAKSGDTMTGDLTVEGNVSNGNVNKALGNDSHAEGSETQANGDNSHAEGILTEANGFGSHAEGYVTKSIGQFSHAEGIGTKATNIAEHSNGVYNISTFVSANGIEQLRDNQDATLFSVGNGIDDNNRRNAFEIKYNGDVYFSGDTKFAKTITADTISANTISGGDLASNTALTDGLATKEDKGVAYSKTETDTLLGNKANVSDVYTKSVTNNLLADKANTATTYSKTEVDTAIDAKVDKVSGKVLSSNDYTDAEKTKLSGLSNYNDSVVTKSIADEVKRATDAETALGTRIDGKVSDVKLVHDTVNPLKYTLMVDTVNKGEINIPKDQFLKSASYDDKTKELVFVFEVASGASESRVDVSHLVDTYSAGNGLLLADNEFSIDTAITYSVAQAKTDLGKKADNTYVNTQLNLKANQKYVDDELSKKLNYSVYTTDYTALTNNLNKKVYASAHTADISTVKGLITTETARATTAESALGTRIDGTVAKSGDTMTGSLLINSRLNVGSGNTTNGTHAFAQGAECSANGHGSHAEGANAKAIGIHSHAEGSATIATGGYSHAEGRGSESIGNYSHAEGEGTKTNNRSEHANGLFNVSVSGVNQDINVLINDNQATLFSVGNGANNVSRKNAFEIKYSGDAYLSGNTRVAKTITSNALVANQISGATISATTITSPSFNVFANKTEVDTALGNKVSKNGDTMTGDLTVEANVRIGSGNTFTSGATTGKYAFAQGFKCTAIGNYAHAEGEYSTAIGLSAHAEGNQTTASGNSSHSEGEGSQAIGISSHAEGASKSIGVGSHSEGSSTQSIGFASHAEGLQTIAKGEQSHAEGWATEANGVASHVEGDSTIANNLGEHASGSYNISIKGASQEAFYLASDTEATLFSVGNGTGSNNKQNAFEIKWNGDTYIPQGNLSLGYGNTFVSGGTVGTQSFSNGDSCFALGHVCHTEGYQTIANGQYSHTEGYITTAQTFTDGSRDAKYSHAEGFATTTDGIASHSEGSATNAYGHYSHAEGEYTVSYGKNSHAEGVNTRAMGDDSHTEGNETRSEGKGSHSEGSYSKSKGDYSHAEGINSITYNYGEHANGAFNISNAGTNQALTALTTDKTATLFSVGNGTSDSRRKNALEIKYNGDIYITNPLNGKSYKLQDLLVFPT